MIHNPIAVLFNAASGQSNVVTLRQTLEDHLCAAAIDYQIYQIGDLDSIARAIRQAREAGAELIVAAGGDGTVSAVADSLQGSQIPMAILPTGTANLLARELQIPLALKEACALLVDGGQLHSVDTISDGKHTYVSHVSMGIYANLAAQQNIQEKARLGRLSYLLRGLVEIRRARRWQFRIGYDDHHTVLGATLVLVANISQVGIAGWQWGTHIRPDDGQMDICIVSGQNARSYLQFLWHLARGTTARMPDVHYLGARRRIKISADPSLPIRGDGEVIGHGDIELQVAAASLRILIPRTEQT